ncbi:MAG: ABC transporter substrate-binding protein [Eubacteriales bacterium]|nr:ABC transporter substrate-binding protein [Eubacteriales bacterium]
MKFKDINFKKYIDVVRNRLISFLRADKKNQIIFMAIFVVILIGAYKLFLSDNFDTNIFDDDNKEKNVKQEVILAIDNVRTLNPIVSHDKGVYQITPLIFDSLFTLDENMTPQPLMVDSYTLDGTTLNIKLKNMKDHNNENITAEDVVNTFKAIKNSANNSLYFDRVSGIKSISGSGSELKVEFLDKKVNLTSLTFPVLGFGNNSSFRDGINSDIKLKVAGTGRYVIKSFNESKGLKLEPFDAYHEGKAKNSIEVNITNGYENNVKLVETSGISVLYTEDINIKSNLRNKDAEVKSIVSNDVEIIWFNNNNEFLKDYNFRSAIANAIDIDSIINDDYAETIKGTAGIFKKGYMTSDKTKRTSEYDLAVAKKDLKKAGYKDLDGDGVVDKKDKKSDKKISSRLNLLVANDNFNRLEVADRIKKDFNSIGVDINIVSVSKDVYLNNLKNKNFDICIGGISLGEKMDITEYFYSRGENNIANINNKKIDENLDKFNSETDIKKCRQYVQAINDEIEKNRSIYCIGYKKYGIVKSPVIRGDINSTISNIYKGIETWYCEYDLNKTTEDENKDK